MWLVVFDDLLKAFNGRKKRLLGLEDIFFGNLERVRGLTLSCGNGKSEGVVGGYNVNEIPFVVGIWIFSGNTKHLK